MPSILKGLFAACLVVAFFAGVGWIGRAHVERAFDKQTRLGIAEERIAGISREFMRRSAKLEAVWDEFVGCMSDTRCDPADILARRDRIIAHEWPEMYDRLAVRNDWGTARDTADARDIFLPNVTR